jgi:hypothetical protein
VTAVQGSLRKLLKRIVAYTVLSVSGVCALAYAVDYCAFRIRLATNRQPFDSVTVTRYYAVPQKNGKTEFLFDPPGPQMCANSLFAQAGYAPCWYLKRHPEQRTDI